MRVRRVSFVLVVISLCYVVFAWPNASFGEDKPTGQFSLTAANQYVWRGYELSRNSVVFQPSVSVGYKGFSASIWGNLDSKPYAPGPSMNDSAEWNETDLTFTYTKNFKLANLSGGYIYYNLAPLRRDLPDRPDAQEFFISLSLNTLFAPTLTVYREVSHYKNWYVLLGLSHELALSKVFALKISGSVSYLISTDEECYPAFDDDAQPTTKKFKDLHDGTVSVSLPTKLNSMFTLTPALTYIFPLSQDAKREMKGFALKGSLNPSDRDDTFWVGSLTLSFSF